MSTTHERTNPGPASDVARGPVGLCDWIGDTPDLIPFLIGSLRSLSVRAAQLCRRRRPASARNGLDDRTLADFDLRRPKIGHFDQVRWRPGHPVTGRPAFYRTRTMSLGSETTAGPRLTIA